MIEIYKTNIDTNELEKINTIEKGCWINVVSPNVDEINRLYESIGINNLFSNYLLDYEERARTDYDDNQRLIVVDVPYLDIKGNNITVPLSILFVNASIVITSASVELDVINDFKNGVIKTFYTYKKTKFLFQILYQVTIKYLKSLNDIIKKVDVLEEELKDELDNKEILKMLSLSKGLVYYSTSLQSNELVFERIFSSKMLNIYEDEKELLADVIVENKQAIEMTKIYSGILNSATETYSSLISNNLNVVMKFLAAITIVLSIPTMIASLFGMNVTLPYSSTDPLSFAYILIISFIIAILVLLLLKYKKML